MNLNELTITDAAAGLATKEFSSEELIRACLRAIDARDGALHAYLTVDADGALAAAKIIDARRASGEELGALAGIPIAVKDVIATKGIRTTAASRILEHYIPPYDATAVARLKDAGAIILGKTNCDEFAHGASTEYSAFGVTKNPWDVSRVAGGSSGGSVAATAADLCMGALGTDTGGSIRQPAAFCGRVGLKPTYGRVSRYGLLSMTSSTDTLGTIAKTVRDAALMLDAVTGADGRDATAATQSLDPVIPTLSRGITGVRVGIPAEYFAEGLDPRVKAVVEACIKELQTLGCSIEPVSLPHTRFGIAVYYIVTPSEISSNLARYDGIRFGYHAPDAGTLEEVFSKTRAEGFGPEAKRRIMLGTYALSSGYYDAYYTKASRVREKVRQDFDAAFKKVDVLVTPTAPHPAFKIGSKIDDPLQLYLEDIFVTGASLAGLPAISVPAGMVQEGGVQLPVGAQIIGKHFDEATILRVAHAYEQATAWHTLRPPLSR